MLSSLRWLPLGIALLIGACTNDAPQADAGMQDGEIAAAKSGADWPTYGATYAETHFSPLTEIRDDNVARLGLAATTDLGSDPHGATTPLAVNGVIYLTVGQARVHAVEAKSGKLLWVHDPQVAAVAGHKLRYAWGARGLAYWDGMVFVGTLDGRLIALDAKTGEERWSTLTTMPGDDRYITGAPRVFNGLVIVGHGGADVAPVRGYVTAYDARTGKQAWRFFTVPGDPAKGFEDDAQERAAATWTGKWWEKGAGGTVWNAITYDPEFDAIYLGVGNGAPYNQRLRSPEGGDNLYLSSVVALDAKTGAYRWHYQETPAETWDYTATQDITLATLQIAGQRRKVILHAPKNGFFYVIDRETGKPISAEPFADKVTWATHIDPRTWRPVEAPDARKPGTLVWPSSVGAHNWQPMAFSPSSGLVYIPTIEMPGIYDDTGLKADTWKQEKGRWNVGYNLPSGAVPANAGTSYLQAWDPVAQKRVWKAPLPGAWPGGVMATGGNLVFNGQADGLFKAYDAKSGKELWSYDCGLGITGGAISFSHEGRQYVAVVAGWGGLGSAYFGKLSPFGWQAREKRNTLFVFALDGSAKRPTLPAGRQSKPLVVPGETLDPALIRTGGQLFATTCVTCHGAGAVAAGTGPDLRESAVPTDPQVFRNVVVEGALLAQGMPAYPDLDAMQVEAIRQFIRSAANGRYPDETGPPDKQPKK